MADGPGSEVDIFLMDVDEEDGESPPTVDECRQLSRSSGLMDESLDRHIDMKMEQLLAGPEVLAAAAASQLCGGNGNRSQRGRPRKASALPPQLGPQKRVTRQTK